ncbi:MAG: hypothetical protein PVH19_00775 [Planctomycetia bacterium]
MAKGSPATIAEGLSKNPSLKISLSNEPISLNPSGPDGAAGGLGVGTTAAGTTEGAEVAAAGATGAAVGARAGVAATGLLGVCGFGREVEGCLGEAVFPCCASAAFTFAASGNVNLFWHALHRTAFP